MFSDEEDREYENFNYINQEYQGEKIDINTNNIKIQEYSMKIMKTHTNKRGCILQPYFYSIFDAMI